MRKRNNSVPTFKVAPKKKVEKKQVGLMLDQELYDSLERFAKQNNVSIARAGIHAIKFAIEHS